MCDPDMNKPSAKSLLRQSWKCGQGLSRAGGLSRRMGCELGGVRNWLLAVIVTQGYLRILTQMHLDVFVGK